MVVKYEHEEVRYPWNVTDRGNLPWLLRLPQKWCFVSSMSSHSVINTLQSIVTASLFTGMHQLCIHLSRSDSVLSAIMKNTSNPTNLLVAFFVFHVAKRVV